MIRNQSDQITVIIVSSYSPCHPSTYLIDSVLCSLKCFSNVENCPKVIILDGYDPITESEQPELKRGKLNQDMIDKYELYCQNLIYRYQCCSIVRGNCGALTFSLNHLMLTLI
jgi:hypothetical protein